MTKKQQTFSSFLFLLVNLLFVRNVRGGICMYLSKEQWAAAIQEAKCTASRGWKAYNETECSSGPNKTVVSWRPKMMHQYTREEVDEMVQEAKDAMNGYWEGKEIRKTRRTR